MTDEIPPHLTDAERGRWWACTATETTSDVLVRRNDLRTISHLRALLADEHAKRCAAELDHAGAVAERDELKTERDQALAACVEMWAALEEASHWAPGDRGRMIDAILSRTDLGAGMVVVEREVLETTLCALLETPAGSRTRDARIEAGRALRDALMRDKKGGG